MPAVVDKDLVDNGGIPYQDIVPGTIHRIAVQVMPFEIPVTHKHPMVVVIVVGTVKSKRNANARLHGCPAVIAIGPSPVDPGGSPFIVRNPKPSIIVVIIPATIMEWCPTPFVIRDPGPAEVGQHPIAISRIRGKIGSDIRDPDITIILIINPITIRAQGIIKNLKIDLIRLGGELFWLDGNSEQQ